VLGAEPQHVLVERAPREAGFARLYRLGAHKQVARGTRTLKLSRMENKLAFGIDS